MFFWAPVFSSPKVVATVKSGLDQPLYFDISKPTFIFTDANQSGLSAILAQGSNKDNAEAVAFASSA